MQTDCLETGCQGPGVGGTGGGHWQGMQGPGGTILQLLDPRKCSMGEFEGSLGILSVGHREIRFDASLCCAAARLLLVAKGVLCNCVRQHWGGVLLVMDGWGSAGDVDRRVGVLTTQSRTCCIDICPCRPTDHSQARVGRWHFDATPCGQSTRRVPCRYRARNRSSATSTRPKRCCCC